MRRGIQTIVGGVIGLTWWVATVLGLWTWSRLIAQPGLKRAHEVRPNRSNWTYRFSVAEIIGIYALTIAVGMLVVVLVAYPISKLFRFRQLDLRKILRGLLIVDGVFFLASWTVNPTNSLAQLLLFFGFLGLATWWSAKVLLATK